MRLVGCKRGLLVLVVGLITGCFDISEEQKQRDVCTAFCSCFVSTPQVEECVVDECAQVLQPTVSDPCLDCVYANSQMCGELEDNCTDLCLDI